MELTWKWLDTSRLCRIDSTSKVRKGAGMMCFPIVTFHIECVAVSFPRQPCTLAQPQRRANRATPAEKFHTRGFNFSR